MYPELFNLSGFSIKSYGVMVAIGYFLSYILLKTYSIYADVILNYSIIFGLIGARIGYFLLYPEEFRSLMDIIKIWEGGLVFHGGIILAAFAIFLKYKKNTINVFDDAAIVLPLGHFFGKIGCFLAGCCYGKPSAFGVVFTNPSYAPEGIRIFPVQILEALLSLILFFVLWFMRHRFKEKKGFITGFYLSFYGIIRFIVEFFRGEPSIVLFNLTIYQIISIILMFAGDILIIKSLKK